VSKQYLPREFPNLPSLEESQALWRAERDRLIPPWLRLSLALALAVGIGLLVMSALTAPSTCTVTWLLTLSLSPVTPCVAADMRVVYAAGLLLTGFPVAYLPLAWAHLPPKPTRARYLKTLARKRALHAPA